MAFSENQAREIFFNRVIEYAYHVEEALRSSDQKFNQANRDLVVREAYRLAEYKTAKDTGHLFKFNTSSLLYGYDDSMKQSLPSMYQLDPIKAVNLFANNVEYQGQIGKIQQFALDGKIEEFYNTSEVFRQILDADTDPMQMIRYDLYQRAEDIGKLEKRLIPTDYFLHDEHEYHRINEIIYRYHTDDADKQAKLVPLDDIEREYITRMGINPSEHSPDELRAIVKDTLREKNEIIDQVEYDRYRYRLIQNVLNDSIRNDTSLVETLMNHQDTDVFKSVMSGLGLAHYDRAQGNFEWLVDPKGYDMANVQDRAVMHQFELYLGDERLFHAPTYFSGLEKESKERMRREVASIISETFNEDSKMFASYHEARKFREHYNGLMNELFSTKRELAVEFKEWMDFYRDRNQDGGSQFMYKEQEARHLKYNLLGEEFEQEMVRSGQITQQEIDEYRAMARQKLRLDEELTSDEKVRLVENQKRNHLGFDFNEMRDLHDYHRRMIEIEEANEHFYQLHYEKLQANKTQTLVSPINQIRAEMDRILYGVDEAESKELRVKIANAIQSNDLSTYKQLMGDTGGDIDIEGSFQRLQSFYQEDPASFSYEVIRPKEMSTENNRRWLDLADSGQKIYVPGDKVGHSIESFENDRVTLIADHVASNQLSIRLGMTVEEAKEDLKQAVEKTESIRYTNQFLEEERRIKDQFKINETFVEVVYQSQLVSDNIHKLNEQAMESVNQQVDLFKQLATKADIQIDGTVSSTVNVHNLVEQYWQYLSRMDSMLTKADDGTIKADHRLPRYLQDMISSHASWMQTVGAADELVSMSATGLMDALNTYAERSRPINLTDEGFVQKWKAQGYNESQIETMLEGLESRSLKERLDDYIFMDVLTKMHQNWFETASRQQRDSAIDNILVETHEKIMNVAKLKGENPTFLATAEQVQKRLRDARKVINKFPHYAEATQLSVNEIAERLAARYQNAGIHVSYEEHFENVLSKLDEVENYNSKTAEYQSNQDIQSAYDAQRAERIWEESTDGDAVRLGDLGEAEQARVVRAVSEGTLAKSKSDIESFLDVAEANGDGRVFFNDGEKEGYIYRGTKGDLLAYYPNEDRTVRVVDDLSEATSRYHSSELNPMILHGKEVIEEDIVRAGELQRNSLGSYEDLQRRGYGITKADPVETVNVLKDFIEGKTGLTYLDMETTGVSNSSLNPELLRPLEIYAQKVQWQDGKMVTGDDLHILVKPTQEMEDHLHHLIANEDFMVHTDNGSFSIVEYANQQALKREGEAHQLKQFDDMIASSTEASRIRKEVDEKLANFWYMRNIAKYGLVNDSQAAARYGYHTGNKIIPKGREQDYLKALMIDANQGLTNLKNAGVQGEGRVQFGDKQVSVANYETIARLVNDFVGDDALAGQNFAEADWAKILDAANRSISESENRFHQTKAIVTNDINNLIKEQFDRIQQDILDQVGMDDIYEYTPNDMVVPKKETFYYENPDWQGTMLTITENDTSPGSKYWVGDQAGQDIKARQRYKLLDSGEEIPSNAVPLLDVLKGPQGEEWLLNAGLIQNPNNITEAEWDKLEQTYVKPVEGPRMLRGERVIGEEVIPAKKKGHTMTNRGFDFFVREGISKMTGMSMSDVKSLAESEPERFQQLRNEVIQSGVEQGVIRRVEVDPNERLANQMDALYRKINLAVHDKEKGKVQPLLSQLGELVTTATRIENMNPVDGNQGFEAAKRIVDSLDADSPVSLTPLIEAQDELELAKALPNELRDKRLAEQMFLSKLANPNMRNHRQEDQIRAAGLMQDESLHMADTDVHTGIKIFEHNINKLLDDPEFANYQPEPLQVGDMVHHHRQLREDLPLGIYEVTNIGDRGYTLRGEDGVEHQVSTNSQLQRNRDFYQHFDFVGTAGSDEALQAINDYHHDVQREQLSAANRSAFAFDLHELQSKGSHQKAIQEMKNIYDNLGEDTAYDIGGLQNADNVLKHVAASSVHTLNDADFNDWMNKEISDRQRRAYEANQGYFDSAVGKKQGAFLREVDNLQKTGVIQSDEAKDLIRQMNEEIKQRGREAGYTRQHRHKVMAGTLPDTFGRFADKDVILDTSSRKKLVDSIWRQAEDMISLAPSNLTESQRKGMVLNQHILPFLHQQGLVSSGEDGSMPTIDSAAREIMYLKEQGKLQPFEEIDFTRYDDMSKDSAFLQAMDDTANRLLEEPRSRMTPLQESRIALRDNMIQTLKDQEVYHPALNVMPKNTDVIEETINFGRPNLIEGLSRINPDEAIQIANQLSDNVKAESDLKNRIFNELFKQATSGRAHSMESSLEYANQPRREAAMRALNWIDDEGNPTPIQERYVGASLPIKNGYQFASYQVKDLPTQLLDMIEQGGVQGYTKGDGTDLLLQQIAEWSRNGAPGQSSQAGYYIPSRQVVKGDNLTQEQLDRMNQSIKNADVEAAARRREQTTKSGYYVAEDLLSETDHRPRGAIEQGIDSIKTKTKETIDSIATTLNDTGLGKAGKWIAGVGVAAYALNQFIEAGNPLKFERQPLSHDALGVNGEEHPPSPKTNIEMGGKSYQTVENSGKAKGYKMKVTGEADNDEAFYRAQQRIKENLGDANVRIEDSRESHDRNWLQEQFSNFLDRGHI